MKNWKEIQFEIWIALHCKAKIEYNQKTGVGTAAKCSYFTISFEDDSDWEWEVILSSISEVIEKWKLELDTDSDTGDFDLNVTWDINV